MGNELEIIPGMKSTENLNTYIKLQLQLRLILLYSPAAKFITELLQNYNTKPIDLLDCEDKDS